MRRLLNAIPSEALVSFLMFIAMVVMGATMAHAQDGGPITATPTEQARIKPLMEALNKASEPLTAKRNALPESKAVAEAQAALQKAVDAQLAASQKLPEFEAVKSAEARLLDEVYRILADHKLSSREYRPEFNAQGELVFVKIPTPPVR